VEEESVNQRAWDVSPQAKLLASKHLITTKFPLKSLLLTHNMSKQLNDLEKSSQIRVKQNNEEKQPKGCV